MAEYERAHEEATADRIFGVPIFIFRGEPFWGHDRIGLLERRLAEAGLAREQVSGIRCQVSRPSTSKPDPGT
jgi:hypothetical protein